MSVPYITQAEPPAIEPIYFAEAQSYLRVNGNQDESDIKKMMKSARMAAERYLSKSLITQDWRMFFDHTMPSKVTLPNGPVQRIIFLRTIARDGSYDTISPEHYRFHEGSDILRVNIGLCADRIEIKYRAGYGAVVNDIPEPIRQGILAHTALLYECRGEGETLPDSVREMYNPYRKINF